MKALVALALLCATLVFAEGPADQAADRTAIEKVIGSLSTAKPVSILFTPDAESDLGRLTAMNRTMTDAANQPWSELTPPLLVIDSVRFITPDVALVNAANTQIGTVPRRVPILFVMRKVGADWKIAALRLLSASALL
jgi:hypothetical protein